MKIYFIENTIKKVKKVFDMQCSKRYIKPANDRGVEQ